ncbi:MAG: aspartate carbamoyltransferase catalytic subunit [Chloroflexi bacterium]|nr:aspartate carbamoyltransferase catalytic subunit [Chloroflexota bacterium]
MTTNEASALTALRQAQDAATAAAHRTWSRRHVLDVDDFSVADYDLVFETADAMREVLGREIKKVPTLRGKSVVTVFFEPSTRTRVSFEMAAKALSADCTSIAAATSSVAKGESLLDTLRTIQSLGADLVVMRHSASGAPYLAARHLDMAIVNAGDGCHAHPTQALLDLYTIRRHLGRLAGLKAVLVGDILHSRVARSNLSAMTTLGLEVTLCGPPSLLPGSNGDAGWPACPVETDLDRALEGADVVMGLRLQLERQEQGLLPSIREYVRSYQITRERLARARPGALLMHPGPVNEGVELTPDVAHGVQSVIEEQVTNGVAIRMALLYLLLGRGQ